MSFRSLPRTADDLLAEILERLRRLELGVVSLPPAEMAGDHGSLGGLDDPDHDQYILHAVATAKGDLLAAPGTGVFDNLPVGADGNILFADSTQTLGVKWDTAGGGGAAYDQVQDDGVNETQRSILNFQDGFVVADDAVDSTDVDLDYGSPGSSIFGEGGADGTGTPVAREDHEHDRRTDFVWAWSAVAP